MNVDVPYTTAAHYWLIKQMVNVDEWQMISNDDFSIGNTFYRVSTRELRSSDAHHFTCQVNKTKSRKQCLREFGQTKAELLDRGDIRGSKTKFLRTLASHHLTEPLTSHQFHKEAISKNGERYHKYANNPIKHPLAIKDKGFYSTDYRTNLSTLGPNEVAKMLLNVNDHSTSSFVQQIRRYISSLKKPLATARDGKKSYIYANFNPKYVQFAITILRTYYNFCRPFKSVDEKALAPVQRLGITDKQSDWKDIIYSK